MSAIGPAIGAQAGIAGVLMGRRRLTERGGGIAGGVRTLALAAAIGIATVSSAAAFDFFGLFGGDKPPEPSPGTLPYEVTFETRGGGDLDDRLQQASGLYRLRNDAPPDGATLVQRAEADFAPLIDALWGAGYFDAKVTIEVSGVPLELGRDKEAAAARAAGTHRNRDRVPVKIVADPGPVFQLRDIAVVNRATRQPFPPDELPPRVLALKPGDPAEAPSLRAAQARLNDYFRAEAHPLVKTPPPSPVVDHATDTMDVTYEVDPGPVAGIGTIDLKGPNSFDPAIVRSFIYLEPGEPYSPDKLDRMRKSVASIPAVGSVRIREGDGLDANGNLPIFVEVTYRAPNLVGISAGYSTLDGPNGRVYYENRNLFGGAERLRLQGEAFLAPRNDGTRIHSLGDYRFSDLGARFSVSFLKPALGGSRFDFLFDGLVERNRTGGGRFGGYTDRAGGGTGAIRYRIDDRFSLGAGLKFERGQTSDVISEVTYQLVGIPLIARYDSTDKPLDPTTGFRFTGTITPYPTALGSSVGFTRATGQASGYYALDDAAKIVLAARVGVGALIDPPALGLIPSNYRFYEGGAGSIRGYRFDTVAPRGTFGFVIGGRSEFDTAFEARIKVTDAIGVIPFVDAGGAYRTSAPEPFGYGTKYAAGLGLSYQTAIGPIRVDLATPINKRRGDQPLVLYISIGQAF